PAKALQAVKCPVLALNGDKDTQVPAWQNLPMIVGALEAGENPRYRVEKFPGLNHLFQNAPTGSVIEYAQIPETISPLVLDVVGEWIQRVLTRVSRRP
ncbi:MAG: alpha/beta hydrolase, partial [Acidobacteria bacterium]|nr:alpha/beta hydrolase [Acidobacteriota bacterium]